jgi:glycosyltransferase involved in cell wall biosynthesis
VEHSVEIGGVVGDRSAMATLLKQAALVVLLSEYESQGIAAMEALALQRRLVVANTTALGDLAGKGWARGISPHAPPDQVAAAMVEQLTADPPPALDLPSWDACAARLGELYRSIIAAA